MSDEESERDRFATGSRLGDFVERVNARLRPYIGGAQLGPRDEPPVAVREGGGTCPICSAMMSEHSVDRSGPRPFLHCPVG